jgi:hypothetical protein
VLVSYCLRSQASSSDGCGGPVQGGEDHSARSGVGDDSVGDGLLHNGEVLLWSSG